MDRLKRRFKTLRNHHQRCEERFDKSQTKKDNCPSSGEHLKEKPGDEPDKACYLSTPSSSEDEELSQDSSLSTHSGSDVDYKPPPPSTSSSDDQELSQNSQSSRDSAPEKHHHHHSSYEIGEAKDQKAKGESMERDMQSKTTLKITVKKSKKKDGARVWDKAHYCIYCKKAQLKIARHLERKHGDECDAAYAFSFPVGSKKRKTLLETLRNKGDWEHNRRVLEEGSGEIVTWKQPSENVDIERYLPCQHCYAMFMRTELWRHERSCRERKEERVEGKRARVQKSSSQLIPIKESSNGVQDIIHSMLQDRVTSEIRRDEMICAYGDALFAKKGREQSQHRYIAQKLRELGRFLMAAKEIDKGVHSLRDICNPANFQLAIKAARHVSNYDSSKREYGKPSTAVKIGFSLKGATEAWIGHCLMMGDVQSEKRAKRFKELLDNSWSTYVSTNAHSTLEQRKWGKEDNVPLTEDIVTLQNYLRKVEDEAIAELRESVSTRAYKKLSESLLAQIIVFNKKREGEASRLTLETYLKADTGTVNKDIYETLSPVEKQLSHRLTRLVTRGKRGRKVPILLLERTKASLDFLIEKRREVGILEENPFLFARLNTKTNLRGCDCLRRYAEESKAKNPELLRSTKLRKHVATLCQLLDLNSQELEQVARFMGHDIRVHCEYYRQTDKTFQVAKIGKLLFAMEDGTESLKGKNLQTLDSVINGRGRADRQQEANDDEQQLPSTSSSVQRQKKTDYDDSDGEVPCSGVASSLVERQCHTARRRHDEDDGGADGSDVSDGNMGPGTENTDSGVHQETSGRQPVKLKERTTGDGLGRGRATMTTKGLIGVKKRRMSDADSQQEVYDDGQEMESKKHGKRPWTNQESTAVKRHLAKFLALKKVPAKQDCLMCIDKESPVLRTRTWKDVKYFVYNEIVKMKRKLVRGGN